ncbi:hypothetical protein, partial [Roseibium sediminis]|uniref:hypothetical protein n=1 Tax=Roseibium sediminis TaxID=1775174 RepID=UPI0013756643
QANHALTFKLDRLGGADHKAPLNFTQVDARHNMLTHENIRLRRTFPWSHSIRKILYADRPVPFSRDHLFIGSDYGGNHKGSAFNTYAYLLVNGEHSDWVSHLRVIRSKHLKDGRRMSFKRLSDPERQVALVPFLEAADVLNGHLVVFAIDKSVRLYPTKKADLAEWKSILGLSAKWNSRAFETAFLKTHLFTILLAQWASRHTDITWISDQDEFVANDYRLDDIQQLAARLHSLYIRQPMGTFAMNTTEIDGFGLMLEDLVAIPDLAAGMIAEICSHLKKEATWPNLSQQKTLQDDQARPKSELLADWFWYKHARLSRTCIVIDKILEQLRVFRMDKLDV